MPTLRSHPRYIVVLACSAAAILVVGTIFRPQPKVTEAAASPSPADVVRLQRLTLKRNVEGIADFFSELARDVAPLIVRLQRSGGSAVVWAPTLVAACGGERPPPASESAVGPDEAPRDLTLAAAGPHLPLTFYRLEGDAYARSVERAQEDALTPGAWALAAWRGPDNELRWEHGQVFGPAQVSCNGFPATSWRTNLNLRAGIGGAGLFDLEGALIGLIGLCGSQYEVFDASTVERLAERNATFTDRLLSHFGLRVSAADPVELARLEASSGLLINEVWRGYPAYRAGLRPGDVIVELDRLPVEVLGDLQPLINPLPRKDFTVTVLRGGERRIVTSTPGAAETAAGGVLWEEPAPGVPLADVAPDSPVGAAGLQAGDRILSVDGAFPASPAEANELFELAEGPVYAVVERDGRLWGTWLQP